MKQMPFTSYRTLMKQTYNYASSEHAILDLVYIPAVITLMSGAS